MPVAKKSSSSKDEDKKTRILIVDDHEVVRYGLEQMIAREPDFEVCAGAADADEGIRLTRELSPDVVIVDISLKGRNGIDLIKELRAWDPKIKILVLSMHDERLFAKRALAAGAMGYVNKVEAMTSAIEAIRRILEGKVYLSDTMTESLLDQARGGQKIAAGSVDDLSDRELEVFMLLGEGLKTGAIAKRLHLSHKTVGTHCEHIKSKLDLASNVELIRQAVEWRVQNQAQT